MRKDVIPVVLVLIGCILVPACFEKGNTCCMSRLVSVRSELSRIHDRALNGDLPFVLAQLWWS
eukprot:6491899-Amphidinium_carterae.1